jgi:hypothetical protein
VSTKNISEKYTEKTLLVVKHVNRDVMVRVGTRRALYSYASVRKRLDAASLMATTPALQEMEVDPHTKHKRDLVISVLIVYVRIVRQTNKKATYDLRR